LNETLGTRELSGSFGSELLSPNESMVRRLPNVNELLTDFINKFFKNSTQKKEIKTEFIEISNEIIKINKLYFEGNKTRLPSFSGIFDLLSNYIKDIQENTLQKYNNKISKLNGTSSSLLGTIYDGNINGKNTIRKLQSLNRSQHRFKNEDTFASILIESIIHYFLNIYSSMALNDLFKCFPQYYPEYQTITKMNIQNKRVIKEVNGLISRMDKIKNCISFKEYVKSGISKKQLLEILGNIVLIIQYYQNNINFVHGDLHDNNILINPKTHKIWIIDFGFSSIKIQNDHSLPNGITNFQIVQYNPISEDLTYNHINHSKSMDLCFLIYTIFLEKQQIGLAIINDFNQKIEEFNSQNPEEKKIFNIDELFGMVGNSKLFNYIQNLVFYKFRQLAYKKNNISLDNQSKIDRTLDFFNPDNLLSIIANIHETI
jgi:hypothetical protein